MCWPPPYLSWLSPSPVPLFTIPLCPSRDEKRKPFTARSTQPPLPKSFALQRHIGKRGRERKKNLCLKYPLLEKTLPKPVHSLKKFGKHLSSGGLMGEDAKQSSHAPNTTLTTPAGGHNASTAVWGNLGKKSKYPLERWVSGGTSKKAGSPGGTTGRASQCPIFVSFLFQDKCTFASLQAIIYADDVLRLICLLLVF